MGPTFAYFFGTALLFLALIWNMERFLNYLAVERGRAQLTVLSAESHWHIAKQVGYWNAVLSLLPFVLPTFLFINIQTSIHPHKMALMIANFAFHCLILIGLPLIFFSKLKNAAKMNELLNANKNS